MSQFDIDMANAEKEYNELKKEIQFLIKIILNKEDGGKNEKQKNS